MTLREKINDILGGWIGNDDSLVLRDDVTDRILAAAREEMLSEDVIEVMVVNAEAVAHLHQGTVELDGDKMMTAALTAAGVTESEVEP